MEIFIDEKPFFIASVDYNRMAKLIFTGRIFVFLHESPPLPGEPPSYLKRLSLAKGG